MRRRAANLIALAFLVYGLIRLGVGSVLLAQAVGLIDFPVFQEPLVEIGGFLAKSSERQIIAVSVPGYLGYIALMGLALVAGAFRTLKHLPFGLPGIGTFIAMYVALFVNFQTINPKAIHLAVCIVLFITLIWLKGGSGGLGSPSRRAG